MDEQHHVEQYYFNGTPAQFGREVKILILNGDEYRKPRRYIAPDYTRHRPYYVHLLNQERTDIIGRVETRRDRERTVLNVSWPPAFSDGARESWDQLYSDLASLEWQIEMVPAPPRTDSVFEEYYQRRAKGDKVTLESIGKMLNYSPAYLRRIKKDYDRRTGRYRSRNTK